MSKQLKKVISVTTSVTTIVWLSGVAALAPMAALATTINEGDTIKTATNPDVYIAKYVGAKKFKRLVLSPAVFNSYGHLSWSKIKTVSQAEMDAFTTSELVRAVGDPKVYKLTPNGDDGSKQWVNMTAEAFTAGGWDWASIYEINTVDRDNYSGAAADIIGGTPANPTLGAGTVTPSTGGVSVSLASDTPAAGVAVGGAARVPFTKVTFTAGSAAATITGLTVQRTGLADDSAISSIALIDASDNTQIGLNQTLNAAHQASFLETITIPANTSKSYVLAANMPALATAALYAGQIASLSLVSVTSAGTVSGALPVTGNGQTINGTLTIGTATVTAGAYDPQTAATKEVGTTNYNFASVKVTAGSAEDVTVYSVRFNQSGSASATDLTNIKVSDGTTDYATTVSADGKYYTANFGSTGLVITKGLNKDFTIKGDILNGSARTVSFDIYRNTDIVIKGNLYGYYMTPSFTANGATHATANATTIVAGSSPYFAGAHVTIGAGSLRVDKNSTLAPTANITEGATSQVLGAFDFVVQGEPVNITSIRLDFDNTGTGSSSDLTLVTLAKEDGTVLGTGGTVADDTTVHASTLDGATNDGHVTFSGTISLPVGTTKVLVKGNLNTDFAANDTFRVGFATTGVGTNITNITGATTGNAITATPSGAVWGSAMTVKSGAMSVTLSSTPAAQYVIKGAQDFTFANLIFDATNSGEDVRVTQVILYNSYSAIADVQSMKLYDGTTLLNSTAVTPVAGDGTPDPQTFTLSTPLIITKGTQKTIAVKGNVASNADAAHTQRWGIRTSTTDITAVGVSTGQTVTVSTTQSLGPTMTVASAGQYSVTLDSSSPETRLATANSQGNIMTVLRLKATSEDIQVLKLGLNLSNASSSPLDVTKVSVWDWNGNKVAEKSNPFNGLTAGTNAYETLTIDLASNGQSKLILPVGVEKLVTIKADINEISTEYSYATAGHMVTLDFYGSTSTTYNDAKGLSSGDAIANYSSNTAASPAYIFKSVPTVTKLALDSGANIAGGVLYRFRVAADSKGDIALDTVTFRVSTTTASAYNFVLYKKSSTGALTQVNDDITGVASATTDLVMDMENSSGAETPITIPAGSYQDFELRASVSGDAAGASINTDLMGDADDMAAMNGGLMTASNVQSDGNNDFIWSDLSKAGHALTTADWFNGYMVNGLSSAGLGAQGLQH